MASLYLAALAVLVCGGGGDGDGGDGGGGQWEVSGGRCGNGWRMRAIAWCLVMLKAVPSCSGGRFYEGGNDEPVVIAVGRRQQQKEEVFKGKWSCGVMGRDEWAGGASSRSADACMNRQLS
ncbi:hypothetical protein TcWFU_002299 [Taenia crassiceps]|uniref:Uncharacterized protein n=1 Tax=Taenia crassiceps TaxID=6207 RepID=A0ABR4QDA5_9CEST